MKSAVTVQVPATTANLGPGFDALGMALDLHNLLTVAPAGRLSIVVEGEGAAGISRDASNVAYRAMAAVFERAGIPPVDVPALSLHMRNAIPLARGLGSSAAAVAAGLLAGNALCDDALTTDELLTIGLAFEGHPDNVTPALLGGCIVSAVQQGQVAWARVALPEGLKAVLFIPDFEMPTREARAILPDPVSRADAVFNLSRTALLVAALCGGRLDLLRIAAEDRLHQPARQSVFPAMPSLFEAAYDAGALAAFLSGAGSTVVALCAGDEMATAGAMAAAASRAGLGGRTLLTRPSPVGARVL